MGRALERDHDVAAEVDRSAWRLTLDTEADLARIRAAQLLLESTSYPNMKERLEAAAAPDATFRHTARELLALSAWRANDAAATRQWLDLVHPDDRALFRRTAIAAGVDGTRHELEYRLRRADDTWLHIRQVMEPDHDTHGHNGGVHWFNTIQIGRAHV